MLTSSAGLFSVVAVDLRLGDIARFTRALGLFEGGGVLVLNREGRLLGLPGDPYFDAPALQRQALMHSPEELAWAPAVSAESVLGKQSGCAPSATQGQPADDDRTIVIVKRTGTPEA